MIVIDVPLPVRCAECPCACQIKTLRGDIRVQCNAMKVAERKYVLVDEYAETRPEDCPIKLEIVK